MNDQLITIVAAIVELGLPMGLLLVGIRSRRYRSLAIGGCIGAVPLLSIYVWGWWTQQQKPNDRSNSWALSALWVMGFGFHLVCIVVGGCVGAVWSLLRQRWQARDP